jgi:hypothetical protein
MSLERVKSTGHVVSMDSCFHPRVLPSQSNSMMLSFMNSVPSMSTLAECTLLKGRLSRMFR